MDYKNIAMMNTTQSKNTNDFNLGTNQENKQETQDWVVVSHLYQKIDQYEQKIQQLEEQINISGKYSSLPKNDNESSSLNYDFIELRKIRQDLTNVNTENLYLQKKIESLILDKVPQTQFEKILREEMELKERKCIEYSIQIQKLLEQNTSLNIEKSERMIKDSREEEERLRLEEKKKQEEKEKRLGSFAYAQVDSKNVRQQQKPKNVDHLNQYKIKEKELREEIEQYKQDLDFSNSIRIKMDLKVSEMELEINFLRQILSQKIFEIEKCKDKMVKSNISIYSQNDEETQYNPNFIQKEHFQNLEKHLRFILSTRDKNICIQTIENQNLQKENKKLIQQISLKKQVIQDLYLLNKRANRMDKQQCYAEIEKLQKKNIILNDELYNKEQEIYDIKKNPIFSLIKYEQNSNSLHDSDNKIQHLVQVIKNMETDNQILKKQLDQITKDYQDCFNKQNQEQKIIVQQKFVKDVEIIENQNKLKTLQEDIKSYITKVYDLEQKNQILLNQNSMLLTKVNIDSMEKTKYELFDYKDQNNIYKNISQWTMSMNKTDQSNQALFKQI